MLTVVNIILIIILIWLDGDRESFPENSGREVVEVLTGAEDSSQSLNLVHEERRREIDPENEILTYLDNGHCVLL